MSLHTHQSDRSNLNCVPTSFASPPPCIRTLSAPASHPIDTPCRGNYIVDQSYQSSHSACESDHREATFEPCSAAVPRAPVATSPTTPAVVNESSAHHERIQ